MTTVCPLLGEAQLATNPSSFHNRFRASHLKPKCLKILVLLGSVSLISNQLLCPLSCALRPFLLATDIQHTQVAKPIHGRLGVGVLDRTQQTT